MSSAAGFAAIVVENKSEEQTLESVNKFLHQNNSELKKIEVKDFDPGSSYNFKSKSLGKHTLLTFPSMGLIPKLLLFLSLDLQTEIIAIDEYDTVGYQHFSICLNGVAETVFTEKDEIEDEINVNYEKIIGAAVKSGKLILRAGDTLSSKHLVFSAFTVANNTGIDIDLEEVVGEALNDEKAGIYLMANCDLPTMGQRDQHDFWKSLTG